MSTSINPITKNSTTPTAVTSPAAKDPLADEATFLRLLVSQLQHQDPLNPVDGNQFVSQLTSYSQLEQLIGIHKDTTSLNQPATPGPAPLVPTAATTTFQS